MRDQRLPVLDLPAGFRAIRADAGVGAISTVAFLVLYLARGITPAGELDPGQVMSTVRILAGGLAAAGSLYALGASIGLGRGLPEHMP